MPEPCHVLVVAAGRGSRAGGGVPKQFRSLAGQPLIARTLRAFLEHPEVTYVLPVIPEGDDHLFLTAVESLDPALAGRLQPPAFGGATRQDSVHAGLEALVGRLGHQSGTVLIQDGARPFASPGLIARAIEAARARGAAVPGCTMFDTVKQVDECDRIVATPDRTRLRTVQTPQAFSLALILAAHRRAQAEGRHDLTDDAAVAEFAGHDVFVFEGDPSNTKMTTSEDLQAAETKMLSSLPDIRTGQGFDVHSFAPGDHVWLGGVRIAHAHGLTGHSDADVVLHALTDAILAAIADGDIGTHFPPSDMRWKGASSDIFLKHAVNRVHQRRGVVANLNATVVCEAPRIGPHRDDMRARIAAISGLTLDRVSVTATTSERLGFTGRGEGIAAWGLATVRLPAAGN